MQFLMTQLEPNSQPISAIILMDVSLTANTGSLSHVRRKLVSFSLKKDSPSYLASSGNWRITWTLTHHDLCVARSLRAGKNDYARFSRPITWLMLSRCLNSVILTSVDSSHNNCKKMFKICSFVADFPIKGQSWRTFSASAILTY